MDWSEASLSDPSLAGHEDQYYVGQVVRYDIPQDGRAFITATPSAVGRGGGVLPAKRGGLLKPPGSSNGPRQSDR